MSSSEMTVAEEMDYLKKRIALVFARRETLKAALECGKTHPREGFSALEAVDAELSALDLRFKHLWDAQHAPHHTLSQT